MGVSVNTDGLTVRYGADEGDVARGGEIRTAGVDRMITAKISYKDALSTTNKLIGNGDSKQDGTVGIVVPKGARIKAVEIIAKTAFTSSGTITTSTLVIGLVKASDRVTELDWDGFTTTSYIGSTIDAAGERNYLTPGSTGAGALIGTVISENGYLTVANSQNASHPFTAGEAQLNIYFYE